MTYYCIKNSSKTKAYRISNSSLCLECRHFNVCTTNKKNGREINRLFNEELREKLEAQYNQPDSQNIYKLRKQKAELHFGHIKRNLSVHSFLVRGIEGAKSQMAILSTCFNVTRMITIFGIAGFIEKIIC